MSEPTNTRLRAGAAAALLAVLGAVLAGQLVPQYPSPATDAGCYEHVRVGTAPPGAVYVRALARASTGARAPFGLCPNPDAGTAGEYGLAVLAVSLDGGESGPPLPAGFDGLEGVEELPGWDGGALLEAWVGASAPWPCACARQDDAGTCEGLRQRLGEAPAWESAPPGTTLGEGLWRGAGCQRKPCRERPGVSTMPGACLP